MQAKFSGRCGKCGGRVNVGDEISWSRQERGKVYHVACRTGAPAPLAPTARSKATPAPSVDTAVLAELIRTLMAASGTVPAVESVPEQDEPDESDFDAEPVPATVPIPANATPAASGVPATVPVPKTATTTKGHKLTNSSPWYDVLAAVLPHVNRVLIVGPPSSGKSHTAMMLAGTKHRITMTETTSREDLIGMHHLIDGATKFVPVNFTSAMQNGEAVLVDEIDRYSAECASLLYSLIDDRPHVNLPTGELVEAREGYKVLMTTNETIDTLPAAVQDRIEVIIMASTPHPDALAKYSVPAATVTATTTGGHASAGFTAVMKDVSAGLTEAMRAVCTRYYASQPVPSIRLAPTVRRMRAFANLLSHGIPNEIAAKLVFGNGGASEVLSAITSAEGSAS